MLSFDQILEIEADPEILKFRADAYDYPLWLLVRHRLFWEVQKSYFDLDEPDNLISHKNLYFFDKVKYLYFSLRKNPFFFAKKDILIFASSIDNRLKDGKYSHIVYDAYCNIFPKNTLLLESSYKFNFFRPRINEQVAYYDIVPIMANIGSKLIDICENDSKVVAEFIYFLKNRLKVLGIEEPAFVNKLEALVIKSIKKITVNEILYRALFAKLKPKIIIVECGHYGPSSQIIAIAKQRGIIVVEMQHGYIGKSHIAYNFHDSIMAQIAWYLPEYFFTFGDYWSDSIRIPGKKITIGKLLIEENRTKASEKKENTVLIISSGTMYKEVCEFVRLSYDALDKLGYKVVLRPHPTEKGQIDARYGKLLATGIVLDVNMDLYERLRSVKMVVSLEVSTVLYEALAFCGKVYCQNSSVNAYYEPSPPFTMFNTFDDFISMVGMKEQTKEYAADYFWGRGPAKNYSRIIKFFLTGEK
jgi:hypothetical protein